MFQNKAPRGKAPAPPPATTGGKLPRNVSIKDGQVTWWTRKDGKTVNSREEIVDELPDQTATTGDAFGRVSADSKTVDFRAKSTADVKNRGQFNFSIETLHFDVKLQLSKKAPVTETELSQDAIEEVRQHELKHLAAYMRLRQSIVNYVDKLDKALDERGDNDGKLHAYFAEQLNKYLPGLIKYLLFAETIRQLAHLDHLDEQNPIAANDDGDLIYGDKNVLMNKYREMLQNDPQILKRVNDAINNAKIVDEDENQIESIAKSAEELESTVKRISGLLKHFFDTWIGEARNVNWVPSN